MKLGEFGWEVLLSVTHGSGVKVEFVNVESDCYLKTSYSNDVISSSR